MGVCEVYCAILSFLVQLEYIVADVDEGIEESPQTDEKYGDGDDYLGGAGLFDQREIIFGDIDRMLLRGSTGILPRRVPNNPQLIYILVSRLGKARQLHHNIINS